MTETSRHRTEYVDSSRGRGPVTALRALSALAVLAVLWQGATAGGILMRSRESLELHEAGALAVHLLTGLVAIAAFALWRELRARWCRYSVRQRCSCGRCCSGGRSSGRATTT